MGHSWNPGGFLRGARRGKMGLRSPSGRTFGCLRKHFLVPETISLVLGRDFLVNTSTNLYQCLSTSSSPYQFLIFIILYWLLPIATKLYPPQSLPIFMKLNQLLRMSINLYQRSWMPITSIILFHLPLISSRRPLASYQSVSGSSSFSVNLYDSLWASIANVYESLSTYASLSQSLSASMTL